MYFYISLSIPTAPDEPNFLSIYPMADGTDYAKQTPRVNVIDDTFITDKNETRLLQSAHLRRHAFGAE